VHTIGAARATLPPPTAVVGGPAYRLEAISLGQDVQIKLRDGKNVDGKFRHIVRAPTALYRSRYRMFASTTDGWLPAVGSVVSVTRSRMTFGEFADATQTGSPFAPREYEFQGFDYGALVIAPVIDTEDAQEPAHEIRMALIEVGDIVAPTGQRVTGQDLRRTFATGDVPFMSSIVVVTAAGRSVVQLEEVSQVLVTVDGQQRQLAVLLGAVADVGQFLSFLSSLDTLIR
jgi:hypothetical protein